MSNSILSENAVSVVTTTLNERGNIEELIRRIRSALSDRAHEIIVVDDDSADGTLVLAKRLADIAVGKKERVKPKACCLEQNYPSFQLSLLLTLI